MSSEDNLRDRLAKIAASWNDPQPDPPVDYSKFILPVIKRPTHTASVGRKTFLVEDLVPRYNCKDCGMGWDDDFHVHDDTECMLTRVHES
jgi:hypothetical protein